MRASRPNSAPVPLRRHSLALVGVNPPAAYGDTHRRPIASQRVTFRTIFSAESDGLGSRSDVILPRQRRHSPAPGRSRVASPVCLPLEGKVSGLCPDG